MNTQTSGTAALALDSGFNKPNHGVRTVPKTYEEMFADMPDEIGSGEAVTILGVAGIQGLHYILDNLTDDMPTVEIKKVKFGKRSYNRYQKTQIIELRRYRDTMNN